MDAEIIIWAAIYVGGYCGILAYLLAIALRKVDEEGAPPPGH